MHLRIFVAGAALLSASLAAHADPIVDYTVTIDSTVTSTDPTTSNSLDLVYSVDIDPSATYSDSTSGISLVSVTSSNSSLFSLFESSPEFNYIPGAPAVLTIDNGADSNEPGGYLLGVYVEADPSGQFPIEADTEGGTYFHGSLADETVTITETAVTPEPSSIVLLGTGLLGMAGFVRKRFA